MCNNSMVIGFKVRRQYQMVIYQVFRCVTGSISNDIWRAVYLRMVEMMDNLLDNNANSRIICFSSHKCTTCYSYHSANILHILYS